MLLRRSAGSGNYSYATTRVKARKAFLFPRETYLKLLQMDIPEISRFIGESKYKDEIDELATRYSGIDLMEHALNLNLARDFGQIMGFCKGELKLLIGSYLNRWDVWNIKTILRGKSFGASEDEIRETLVPAGSIDLQKLNDLIHKSAIADVVEGLAGTMFYKPLMEAMDEYNKTHLLSAFENALDKAYYENLLSLEIPGTKADELFINFIRLEIDFVNLRTLFRLKRENVEHEKIMAFMIPGGSKFNIDGLRKLAQAPSYAEFLSMLKEYPYWDEISGAVQKSQETGSLNPVEIALRKALIAHGERISHLYPLSVTPILGYIVRKNTEVNNLRIIARGKESGLSDEVIKSQLVI
ncbi:A-type ATP synthase subunit C [Methanocella conradii HZ254]|uniref:A-type ATP synthase subunit C n=1 Tax=Methanocella conradii (strain DSM 24694 / JCM 17849 / CGMCC 1.5162 / HZ254) TaxID=1041930 RepID=H8I4H3_METCZ|nr:V-type ATP synthase subunit C [Methanocella conradii]AFD00152.1 A-type ATP synthase subunit C [Methanocella conradii HZ254]MDI6896026.1 V-type ATP synthase subunit C [Methanocella conradii]